MGLMSPTGVANFLKNIFSKQTMAIETFFAEPRSAPSKLHEKMRDAFFVSKFFGSKIRIPDLEYFSTKDLVILQAELLLFTSSPTYTHSQLLNIFSKSLDDMLNSRQKILLKLDDQISKKKQQYEKLRKNYTKNKPGYIQALSRAQYKCAVSLRIAHKLLPKGLYSVFLKELNEKMEAYE
jgi:hypothetical protein